MGFSRYFSKFVLGIIFISLWAASACLIVVGAVVWHNAGSIDSIATSTHALVPTVVIIGTGIFLFLLGAIGCFACLNENRCLLSTFFLLMLLILVGEIVGAVLGFHYHNEVGDAIGNELRQQLGLYQNDSMVRSEIDFIQNTYRCCGVHNYTDWYDTEFYAEHNNTLPDSCECKDAQCDNASVTPDKVWKCGCLAKLESDFSQYLALIASFALTVALLQGLGLLASCILMCRSRQSVPYMQFGGPTDERDV